MLLADDLDAGVFDDAAPVDLNQDRSQCFRRSRVGYGAGVPGGHAGSVGQFDDLLPRIFFIAAHEHVALDVDILL